jgi:hydrogenase-4 component E
VLGTSRMSTCIRAIGVQGLLLAGLPVFLHAEWSVHLVGLALGTAAVKAVALPWFLSWAIREANVRREVEPLVGFVPSLLIGAVMVAGSFAVAPTLPLPVQGGTLLVAVALSNVLTGLVVLTSRLKAVTQVVGYLMLENGIYVFGLTQTQRVPFLLELGVLLDVFVGVFIMGIVVFHINREFDSMSSSHLEELKES